jgi:hypothetical protein
LISDSDDVLFKITDSAVDAANEIIDFYRNYHSRRFVGNQLVMRLRSAPSDDELARLNSEYGYLLVDGAIEHTAPLPAEVHDNDALDKARIKLRFDKTHHAGLRKMINTINEFGTAPSGQPPARHYQEQA